MTDQHANENATWYATSSYERRLIRPVTVERFTEQSVWMDGRRHGRGSGRHGYFPTWEAAKAALLADAEAKVDSLRRQLERANGELGNIKGLKP